MYRRMPGVAGAILIAVIATVLGVTGCTKGSSSNAAGPSRSPIPTTSAEHRDLAKGRALLYSCVPNGQAMIGSVMNGTASGLTYIQDARFVLGGGLKHVIICVSTKPGPVPAPQMKAALTKCMANQVTPIIEADHHFIRDRHTILPAVFNAAAICIGHFAS